VIASGAKLRVCFALSTRGHLFGGLETITDHLASGLAARRHQVTLLAGVVPRRPSRQDFPAGIDVTCIPVLPRTWLVTRALARTIGTQPLNVQSLTFFGSCLVRPRVRRQLAQADIVVSLLEGEAVLLSRYLAARGVGTIYYFSGGIDPGWAFRDRSTLRLAISETVADGCRREHAYRTDGVLVPGVARELLGGPPAAERAGAPRLLYVGRLEDHQKRVTALLPILEALVPRFPALTLRLAGDGPTRSRLERAAGELGLADRVIFRGALTAAEVHQELRQATLLVLPSSYESFGIVALEAMAAGVPVVASELPALREATGGHAYLLPADDTALWAQTIGRLLEDDPERRATAARGRAWAAQFTWDRIVDRFEQFAYQAAGRRVREAAGA
jgi:glycosyltransferase involved in cell wall biosynthesis